MGRIYSHSVLEAFACKAKGLDALMPRHAKAGPARQGQLFHRFAEVYLTHLHKEKRDSDLEFGRELWGRMRGQASAADDQGIAKVIEKFLSENLFPWVETASMFKAEHTVYVTHDGIVVDHGPGVVPLVTEWLFRLTADLFWAGDGPVQHNAQLQPVLHVGDWKSHHWIEHVSAPESNRQLLRYAAALGWNNRQQHDGDMVGWLGFPRHGLYEHAVFTREQRLTAWQELVVEPIRQIEAMLDDTDAPERTVGAMCRDCDLRRGCDAALRYPFDVAGMEHTSRDERATAALLAGRLYDDHAGELKRLVAEQGPFQVDDVEVSALTKFSHEYDKARVRKVLEPFVPADMIDECFRPSKTAIEDVLKKAGQKPAARKELLEQMQKGAPKEGSAQLKFTKIKQARKKPVPVEQDDEDAAEYEP